MSDLQRAWWKCIEYVRAKTILLFNVGIENVFSSSSFCRRLMYDDEMTPLWHKRMVWKKETLSKTVGLKKETDDRPKAVIPWATSGSKWGEQSLSAFSGDWRQTWYNVTKPEIWTGWYQGTRAAKAQITGSNTSMLVQWCCLKTVPTPLKRKALLPIYFVKKNVRDGSFLFIKPALAPQEAGSCSLTLGLRNIDSLRNTCSAPSAHKHIKCAPFSRRSWETLHVLLLWFLSGPAHTKLDSRLLRNSVLSPL